MMFNLAATILNYICWGIALSIFWSIRNCFRRMEISHQQIREEGRQKLQQLEEDSQDLCVPCCNPKIIFYLTQMELLRHLIEEKEAWEGSKLRKKLDHYWCAYTMTMRSLFPSVDHKEYYKEFMTRFSNQEEFPYVDSQSPHSS